MILLALETSCDETSAAVVRDGKILSNTVSSQIKLHEEYGGVVPELAAREHLKNLLPVAQAALHAAGISAQELDAVAATQGPGLAIALLVGVATFVMVRERVEEERNSAPHVTNGHAAP